MSPADLERTVDINQANLSDVDAIAIDNLGQVLTDSRIALVAVEPEGRVVGCCLIIDGSCGYLSDRAAWALQTSGSGLHIDRVVFDMQFSGFGLGLALYNELDRRIGESATLTSTSTSTTTTTTTTTLTSLVRVDPPNQHSVGFHDKRGFVEIARTQFDGQQFALTRRRY